MTTTNTIEHICDAFEELTMLNVIVGGTLDSTLIQVDRARLHSIGYALILVDGSATFITLSNYIYMYEPVDYFGNIIPLASLRSYILIQVKSCTFSNK